MIPLISVILPFHDLKNIDYLKATLSSLSAQTDVEFEVIGVLTSGLAYEPIEPAKRENGKTKFFTMPGRSTFAKKMNYGVKLSDPRSKYIMLLSDDVILGRDCLKDMAESCADQQVIMNPMSNCDNGRIYLADMPWPFSANLQDVDADEIMNWPVKYPVQFPVQSNCFYATMIPRTVWDRVGELDESFDTGCEDTDYCLRARQLGIASQITMRAFAFHFVGKTSTDYCTTEITARNHDLFEAKHGFRLVP
jgi:GT2 family glycosyltransferase